MKIFAISGLGVDKRVFQYLKLDHELINVEWIKPEMKEAIIDYSKRIIIDYNIENEEEYGFLGVSFGGLVAIEISKLTKPKFTILISSVETRQDLSGLFKLAGRSKLIELIPEKLFKPPKAIVQYLFGTDRKELVYAILDDTEEYFVKWAVRELINWQNETKLKNLIKIGGSNDKLLHQKGENTIFIENGAHFMIVDKAEEISEVINEKLRVYL
jgi:hypothetical protein